MAIVDDFIDDIVNAGQTNLRLSPIIANGVKIKIKKFGCFVRSKPENGIVALQWGSGSSFDTIRAISGIFELEINKIFVGDGVKRFRLVRINKSILDNFEIATWYEAYTRI